MQRKTLKDIAYHFTMHLKQSGLKYKTLEHYHYALKELIVFLQQNEINYLDGLNQQVVKEYVSHVLNGDNAKRSIVTIAMHLRHIRLFFHYALEQGYILENLSKQIEIPKTGKHISKNYLTKKEITKLFKAIDTTTLMGFTDYTLFQLLYGTGLRINETACLLTKDIVLEESTITVRNTKNGKDRVVPLPEMITKQLAQYFKKVRPELLKRLQIDSPLLFFNYKGKKMSKNWVNHWLRFYATRANIQKQLSCHCFRYSYATHMLEAGIDIRQLAELMGHESLDSTAKYTKILVGNLIKEVNDYHPHGSLKEDQVKKEILGYDILS